MQTKNDLGAVDSVLRAGFGKADITPPVGIGLGGYAGRTGPSEAVAEPLYSRAAVLNCGNTTVAISANDLLFVTSSLARDVRQLVHQKTNIPEEHILVSATHSHSGPLLEHMSMVEEEVLDRDWIEGALTEQMADAICLAHSNMQPAAIGTASSRVLGLAFNRRLKRQDGKVQTISQVHDTDSAPSVHNRLEFGPIDPDLAVLAVRDGANTLMGLLVNFSCHPVCNDFELQTISPDFPGYLTREIEETTGATCLYTTAAAGEIVPTVRNSWYMKSVLAKEVLRLLDGMEPSDCERVWVKRKRIRLPLRDLPSIKEARRQFEEEKAKESSGRFLARRALLYAEQYEGQTHLETEIQIVGMGDILLIGLPGEISVETGLLIKSNIMDQLGERNVFLISIANDWTGELIPDKAYQEGGSELVTSRLGPGSEEVVVANVMELLRK